MLKAACLRKLLESRVRAPGATAVMARVGATSVLNQHI